MIYIKYLGQSFKNDKNRAYNATYTTITMEATKTKQGKVNFERSQSKSTTNNPISKRNQ